MIITSKEVSFADLAYGVYGDIIGRPYEVAFLFLLSSKHHPRIRDSYAKLCMALRTSYPFDTVRDAWYEITGDFHISEMLQRFEELNLCHAFSDDTVLTVAVLDALRSANSSYNVPFDAHYHKWGKRYPKAGFSLAFKTWLREWQHDRSVKNTGETNGSAMRVSPVGFLNKSREEIVRLARASAMPTHGSEEGMLGAQIVAEVINVIRHHSQDERGQTIRKTCKKALDVHFKEKNHEPERFPLDKLQYRCLPTVRHCLAIMASHRLDFTLLSHEDLMKEVLRYGGDTDTIGMICCSIYGASMKGLELPKELDMTIRTRLPRDLYKTFLPDR